MNAGRRFAHPFNARPLARLFRRSQRESALLELSKRREQFSDLAMILWHSCGTIASLLQEICSIYPHLSPPTLTAYASNRVCNALALLQCVASHPETRSLVSRQSIGGWQRVLSQIAFNRSHFATYVHRPHHPLPPLPSSSYSSVPLSTRAPLPLPLPCHEQQAAPFRVLALDVSRSHWRAGEARRFGRHQFSPAN